MVTLNWKTTKAFDRFKIEKWCSDLDFVAKVAKDKKSAKFLLVRQDMFDGTVHAKGMKTKGKDTVVRAILTMITKNCF